MGSVADQLQDLLKSHISSQSNQLYSEICTLQQNLTRDQPCEIERDKESSCGSHFQELLQSALGSTAHTVGFLSPEECLQRLQDVVREGTDCLLSSKQRVRLDVLLSHFKMLKEQQFSHWSEIVGHLTNEFLPIEVVWQLHKNNILPLWTMFDSWLKDRRRCSHLTEQLIQLCAGPKCGLLNKEILSDVCCHLVQKGFPEKKTDDANFRKVGVSILDDLTRGLLERHMSEERLLLPTGVWREGGDIPHNSFKRFCIHTTSLIMSHRPNMKVSEALKRQREWTSGKLQDNYRTLYKQLLVPLSSREVVEMLGRILEKQEVNWRTLLSFLSTFLVCCPSAATLIQEHVSSLLREGLEGGDMETTIVAFLLARQSCTEGPHVFPAYPQWFQSVFSDSAQTPAVSKKAFTFLVKFLTDLVPYEPADILKVHILRPPFVPAKCRDQWTDYTSLAKTRLADLKVPLEETNTAIYADQGNSSTSAEAGAQDVEKAVSVFESSGKLPSTVMEASIFRKPYFVGKFLPALLQPRHLPDGPDSRMRFIEALKKAGKIPPSMFVKYEEACKRETTLLLEGVFEEEDNGGVEEMMMSALEQLTHRLNQLVEGVTSKSTENRVSELVSIISEKIEAVVSPSSDDGPPLDAACILDLCQPALNPLHVKVVDAVLNCVCGTVHTARGDVSYESWLGQLVRMISRHAVLLPALFTRLLMLFTNKTSRLSRHHIEGMAAFVLHLASNAAHFPPLLVKGHNGQESHEGGFLSLFLHSLPASTAEEMLEATRFLVEYLQLVFLGSSARGEDLSDWNTVLPRRLIVLTCLLSWRVFPRTRPGQDLELGSSHHQPWPSPKTGAEATSLESDPEYEESVLSTLFASEKFLEVVGVCSPTTLEEWLEFELRVDPGKDVLSALQRQTYQHSMMSHFSSGSTSSGSCWVPRSCSTVCLQHNLSALMTVLVRALSRNGQRGGQCSLCGQSLGVEVSTTPPNPQAVDQLLGLLSKLTQVGPANHDDDDNADSREGREPWLVKQTLQLSNQHAGNDDVIIVPEAVLRVLLSCPPYLLFSNGADEGTDPRSMECTIQFLEQFLVGCAAEAGVLSFDVTCHLLQGYLTVAKNCRDRTTKRRFENHPLVVLSTLAHWQSLSPLVPSMATTDPWDRIPACLDLWNRWCVEERRQPLPLTETEPFCVAASLYCSKIYRNPSCKAETRKGILQHLHEQAPKIIDCLNSVLLVVLSDVAICSPCLPLKMEIHLQWLSELWGLFPDLIHSTFTTEFQCSSLRRSLMSADLEPFAEMACLRCVGSLPVSQIAGKGTAVSTVVRLFARLCRRFDEDCPSKGSDVALIMDVSKTVVTLLKIAPLRVLQTACESDVKQCGLESFGVYQHRLKNRLITT